MRFYDKFYRMIQEKNISIFTAMKDLKLASFHVDLWKKGWLYPSKRSLKKISKYSGYSMAYWESEDEVDKKNRIKHWIIYPSLLLFTISLVFFILLIHHFYFSPVDNHEYKSLNENISIVEYDSTKNTASISIQGEYSYGTTVEVPEYVEFIWRKRTKSAKVIRADLSKIGNIWCCNISISQYIEDITLGGQPLGITVDSRNPVYDSRMNSNALFNTKDNRLICVSKSYDTRIGAAIIGGWAFYKCFTGTVTVPTGVKIIEQNAYRESNASKLIVSEGVESIGDSAFFKMIKLKEAYLPSSLTYLDSYAFADCNALQHIYYKGTASEFSKICEDSKGRVTPYVYYYSETEPIDAGQYWHYSSDGEFVIW